MMRNLGARGIFQWPNDSGSACGRYASTLGRLALEALLRLGQRPSAVSEGHVMGVEQSFVPYA